ncbi:MAG: hypothetical protein HY243_11890 [Proteobacteria bacterium]|nr:hypothetical protein [Pseudomonadota bacterium]
MIRIILVRVLVFLVPFALYEIYRAIARQANPRPWLGLFIAGLVLVAGSFVYVGLTEGSAPDERYVPPHVENGKLVPGHTEPKKTP